LTTKILNQLRNETLSKIAAFIDSGTISIFRKIQTKPIQAYAQGWSAQQYKGIYAASFVFPGEVEMFERVSIISLKPDLTLESIAYLEKNEPEYYSRFRALLLDCQINDRTIDCLCIPSTYKTVPEWLKPLISYEKIWKMVVALFEPVCQPLGLHMSPIKFEKEIEQKPIEYRSL